MVHRFLDESVHTMNHSPEYVPWRPDKIVMQAQEERANGYAKPTWKCQNVQILGTEAAPKLALSGSSALQVTCDGTSGNQSDHKGMLAELVYTRRNIQ